MFLDSINQLSGIASNVSDTVIIAKKIMGIYSHKEKRIKGISPNDKLMVDDEMKLDSMSSPPIRPLYEKLEDDNTTLLSNSSTNINTKQFESSPRLTGRTMVATAIFFIDGINSLKSMDIWSQMVSQFRCHSIETDSECPPLHRISVGSINSIHEKAVSLFYKIKGGQEDFGEVYASKFKRPRFGIKHRGIYPDWSLNGPIHILAHSFGGNVVMELQRLLSQGFFINELYDTDAGWILSVALVSSPLRGTINASNLINSTSNSINSTSNSINSTSNSINSPKFIHFGTILFYLLTIIYQIKYQLWRSGYWGTNFKTEHYQHLKNQSLYQILINLFLIQLLYPSDEEFSIYKYQLDPILTFDPTYYRTYTATLTKPNLRRPIGHWLPGITLISKLMSNYNFNSTSPTWYLNDGVIPLASQMHPLPCHDQHCDHLLNLNQLPPTLQSGKWYCSTVTECSHFDLIPGPPPLTSYTTNLLYNLPKPLPHLRNQFLLDYLHFLAKVNYQFSTNPNL